MSQQHKSSSTPDPALEIIRSILDEAAQRPWLAALLMRRRPDWLTRLAQWAQRLRNLPRHTRRVLRRKLAYGLAAAALLLALTGTPTAYAVTITVVDGEVAVLANGICSLREAIINANDDAATHPDCAAGSGADVISLPSGGTFSLTDAHSGSDGLPAITTEITIEGNGATIQRTGGSSFRLLDVNVSGKLTLNAATISGGNVSGNGGGILNGGTLTVNNSTVSGNSANYGSGILNSGTLTVNNSTLSGNSASGFGEGGGILNSSSSTLTLNNSTLSGNGSSSVFGGGIFNYGTLTVNNSTLSGNLAFLGGGIYTWSGAVMVDNSTLSGNSALSDGGGIFKSTGTVSVRNSIVALQTSGADCNGAFTSQGYNIESGTSCSSMSVS